MRKSEEIKKAVKLCVENKECAGNDCPYFEVTKCGEALFNDILPFIEHLEEQIAKRDKLLAHLGVSIPKED